MTSRPRLSLAVKLGAGFAAVLALTAIIGAVGVRALGRVDVKAESMYADRVVPIRDLAESRALLGDIDSQIQRAITSDGPAAPFARTSDRDAAAMDQLIRGYRATYLVPPEVRGLRRFDAEWTAYRRAYGDVLA
ncbi:MAG: MCP four helix bundle domain-containing protein, partial [Baekduiaceae bacterium]